MQGVVVALPVTPGQGVREGAALVVLESMKLEHAVPAPQDGVLLSLAVGVGDQVRRDDLLATLGSRTAAAGWAAGVDGSCEASSGRAELRRRRVLLRDEARPEATRRRHDAGRRTVREDLTDLLDPGTWVEWGALAVAAQRARRSAEELEQRTPADGLVTGLGTVNADLVGEDRAHCAVLAYDYAVLAGTQGVVGHLKTDRFLEVVERLRVPVVLFAEGGGGRPGDTDHPVVTGLQTRASRSGPACPAWCRGSVSCRGAASPGMPRCSAVPTS